MEYQTLLIISVFAAIVHVIEEYIFGWIEWANNFVAGITVIQFIVVNTLFVALCIIASIVSDTYIVFSSSIFSLLLINSFVHIAPAIKQMRYSPGLVTAIFLFIPISVAGYTNLLGMNIISNNEFIISVLIGVLWMSAPFIYQALRLTNKNRT